MEKKLKIYGFLQARTGSTRLPEKVLKPILGKAMILHELERVIRSKGLDELILLTSTDPSDDALANTVFNAGFKVFRGDLDDVLARFVKCGHEYGLRDDDIVVRLTGDCPVHDAGIIDSLIEAFLNSDCDYMANCVEPILYPDGLDAEVCYFKALKEADKKTTKLSEREHVTPYIRDSGEFGVCAQTDVEIHPEWRLTVDEPRDFELITKIYEHFGNNEFSFDDIVSFLESNPEILETNSEILRNEGYLKSIEKEKRNGSIAKVV